MNIPAILRRLEDDAEGSIVSMICTAGWHGEPCTEAGRQSASKIPCSCPCHGATS